MSDFSCNEGGHCIATGPVALRVTLTALLVICFQGQGHAFTLLSIRDISQSAGASYFISRSSGSGMASETDASSTEDYSFGFDYSLLAPQLVKGKVDLDLGWQQDMESRGRTSDFRLRYNVTSMLFSKNAFPVSIAANSSRQTISETFGPSYQTSTDNLNVQGSLLNTFIPSTIQYNTQSIESSGLAHNFKQNSNSFAVNATPNLGDLGVLTLGVALTESDSAALENNVVSHNTSALAQGSYSKSWQSPAGLTRGMGLAYIYQQVGGLVPQDSQSLSGNVGWQFGKVLQGQMNLTQSSSSSSLQDSRTRAGSATLTHRLLGSLTTSVNVNGTEQKFDEGDTRSVAGGVAFGYNKRLPQNSNITASYSYSKGYQESSGKVSEILVLNEEHPAPTALPRIIALNHDTFIPETIEVTGAQTLLPYPSSSYTVVPEGIQLVDPFSGDSSVLITYRYRQDPAVTSIATTHAASVSSMLFEGKYRVYADARKAGQDILRGEASAVTLAGSSHFDAGASANLGPHKIGGEIGYDQGYAMNHYYAYSNWSYVTSYARGQLALDAMDRVTWGTQSGVQEPWLNSLSCQASYFRRFNNIAARFKANYSNTTVDLGAMSQVASLFLNLEGKFGKLTAMLTSSANFSFTPMGNSSSQSLGVSVRRSF